MNLSPLARTALFGCLILLVLIFAAQGAKVHLDSTKSSDSPAWSPDGRYVVFNCGQGRLFPSVHQSGVCVGRAGTSERVARYRRDGWWSGAEPQFSPNGKRIVFNDTGSIYVMNADGSQKRLLHDGTRFQSRFQPCWSPSGMQIAFIAYNYTAPPQPSAVFVLNANGTNKRQLAEIWDASWVTAGPVWSPSGRSIVFKRETGLCEVNVDGSGKPRLLLAKASGAAFAADGRLAFTRSGSLCVRSADGKTVRVITRTGQDSMPQWLPDGRLLAQRANPKSNEDLILVNPATGNMQTITLTEGRNPVVSPDGKWLAVGGDATPRLVPVPARR